MCFAFVPAHLRIPYVSGVSFLWTTILSVMQSKFDTNRERAKASAGLAAAVQTAPSAALETTKQ